MSQGDYQPYLEAALEAAQEAAEVIRHYYRSGADVRIKADSTPVTEADVASERVIRDALGGRWPEHGFYGEEMGSAGLDREYLWLVDPIDGTKSFVRRYPFFSTQIALMHRGELVVGVSSAPEFGELMWASKGGGAWNGDERAGVSSVAAWSDCSLSTGNLKSLAVSDSWARLGSLIPRLNRIRGYGDFYHYHLLARGSIDAVVESDVNILDIAALAVIVREAGGQFTDLRGAPLDLNTTSVLATNGRLHQPIREHLVYKG